jgi:heme A synthase
MRVHRFAIATAVATFCLLVAGGLVSATESGLACPDWPLCEGKLIPKMLDGKQFEHTHRLVASAVAAMTFVLCVLIFRRRREDRVLKRVGAAAALLVVVQALLGALTVKLALPVWVSSLHQATAMAFFCVAVTLAFLTRQRMPESPLGQSAEQDRARLRRWILPVIAITYVQVCIGAVMRHTRSGLACGFDFPLCLGQLWPLDAHLGVQLHMLHRAGGFVAAVAVIALAAAVLRTYPARGKLKVQSSKSKGLAALRVVLLGAVVLVLAQIALGIATILNSRELITMTFHSSLGALLLADLVAAYWIACPSSPPALAGAGMREAAASLETA